MTLELRDFLIARRPRAAGLASTAAAGDSSPATSASTTPRCDRGDQAGGGGAAADDDGSASERRTLPSPDVSVTTAIEESRVGDTMRGAASAECARGRLRRVEKGAVMRRGSDTLR